jgi:hypothetical protein
MNHLHPGKAALAARCAALLVGLVALSLSGCGYGTHNLYRDDIKTIYVDFFGNDTYRRQLEINLTHYIVDEIKLRTPLTFAPAAQADSELSGTIVDAQVSTIVKNAKDLVLIQRAHVKVHFRWRDRLTGRDIVAEQTIEEAGRTASPAGGNIFETNPEQPVLFDLALREAARRIVDNMRQSW